MSEETVTFGDMDFEKIGNFTATKKKKKICGY